MGRGGGLGHDEVMSLPAIVASLGAGLGLAAAGCGEPASESRCQVPGELGVGTFAAHDCRLEDGCQGGWRFAAGAVESMIFCRADGQEVTEVVSSDPSVMVTDGPHEIAPAQVGFELRAGAPGRATIELRGPDLVERLALEVEAIAALDIAAPTQVVVGGSAALTSAKRGASGAPLFGRGGYDVTAPAGLAPRPATTATRDCELQQPDVVVRGEAVGSYAIATAAPAPAWTSSIEVVPPAAVTSARLYATRISGSAATGFGAYVQVVGVDAAGRDVEGIACTWRSPRPVFISHDVCWSLVLLPTSEPLELGCTFDGRDLGTIRLTSAIVL
jgi:hypothetical protein